MMATALARRMAAVVAGVAFAIGLAAGCGGRPSEEACGRAVDNIRRLTGQSRIDVGADQSAAVRSCRSQSSRDTVECMAEAQSTEELYRCGGELADKLREEA